MRKIIFYEPGIKSERQQQSSVIHLCHFCYYFVSIYEINMCVLQSHQHCELCDTMKKNTNSKENKILKKLINTRRQTEHR